MAPLIFSIDGNIGSGKSRFLSYLKENITQLLIGLPYDIKKYKFVFVPEPVSLWSQFKDENNKTIIECFYADQKKYAFPFQMMAYISRLSLLKKYVRENPNSIIITERCLETDRHIFAKMLYDDGAIDKINYDIYLAWFDEFIDEIPVVAHIYIKTEPIISEQRVIARNREGESIPLEYLTKCHQYHENWLNNLKYKKVFTLDNNTNIYDNTKINTYIPIVFQFIQKVVDNNTSPYSQLP